MKFLISFFLLMLLAVAIGLIAYKDPGYVLIGRNTTTVEMTLSLFVTIQLLAFALLYLVIRTVLQTWHMPQQLRQWRLRRRVLRSQKALRKGLTELAEGHWRSAERALIKRVNDSETPLLNYLSAARAAQKQHAHERRDHYLSMAAKSMPDADVAVELTQAELQLAHGQLEQALATLEHIRSMVPRHQHVLLLLSQLYQKLDNWKGMYELLPLLGKNKVLKEDELKQLSITTYRKLLHKNSMRDVFKIEQFWKNLPKVYRNEPVLLEDYLGCLLKLEQDDQVEKTIRDALKHSWLPTLVVLYGKTTSTSLDKQLTTAESWLSGHETNADLLLCLARLSMSNKLWGKARSYFEASLNSRESAETYREYGQLLEQLKEDEAAANCFRSGLMLATASPVMSRA